MGPKSTKVILPWSGEGVGKLAEVVVDPVPLGGVELETLNNNNNNNKIRS